MENVSKSDVAALIRDKYNGDASAAIESDLARLAKGEPLAYVIGWIPFLGLHITLDSHPLIPRPETEWWTETLITSINSTEKELRILDLCAGSGAIGLAIEKHCPRAEVFFGEIDPQHVADIYKNHTLNELPFSENNIRESDLVEAFSKDTFDIIATNPPYIPEERTLETSVTTYEPQQALYGGSDGLFFIRKILSEIPSHINASGQLWMECDIENIEEARQLALIHQAERVEIRTDLYGRPRVLVAYY